MYSDYHVHTNYSDDSTYLMEDVIKDAIKMKMDEICFTDHVDYGIKKDWDEGPIEYLYGQPQVNVDYPKYFKEIESLRKNILKLQLDKVWNLVCKFIQYHVIKNFMNNMILILSFYLYIKSMIKNFGHKIIKKKNHNKNI